MHDEKKKTRRWRAAGLLAAGVAIGTVLMATPAAGHIGSVSHLWNHHIKPKADQRYDMRYRRSFASRGTVGDEGCCHDARRTAAVQTSLHGAARVGWRR